MIFTHNELLEAEKKVYVHVVPTTTPPLVWSSNGQNKGAPTKILNPTPMEG